MFSSTWGRRISASSITRWGDCGGLTGILIFELGLQKTEPEAPYPTARFDPAVCPAGRSVRRRKQARLGQPLPCFVAPPSVVEGDNPSWQLRARVPPASVRLLGGR